MSKKDVDETFWDRADKFINIANEFTKQVPRGEVSSSLLYAAARYNSFIVASCASSREEMLKDKEKSIEYFVEQYRKMLEENLDDHINHFKKYID